MYSCLLSFYKWALVILIGLASLAHASIVRAALEGVAVSLDL